MATQKLIRWSGLVLMLGGVGVAVGYIIHPPADTAQYVAYPLWNLSHWVGGIGFLLIPLGLVGLYARQSEKVGLLGLIGFVLTFLGGALSAGATIFISVVFRPIGVARGLDWMEPPNGALFTSFDLRLAAGGGVLALLLGLLLFGVATLRARVLPRWGTWLVILGVPIFVLDVALFGGPLLQGILHPITGLWLGLGFAAWGWALWSEKAEMVAQAKR